MVTARDDRRRTRETARVERKERARAQDREILRLAVPAFLALVAEPLFLLADSAVVGTPLVAHPLPVLPSGYHEVRLGVAKTCVKPGVSVGISI